MSTTVYPVWYTSDNGSVVKHEELIGRDIQCLGNGEEGIERNGFLDIGCLDMPDEGSRAINLLGQCFLGVALQLAVVCDL